MAVIADTKARDPRNTPHIIPVMLGSIRHAARRLAPNILTITGLTSIDTGIFLANPIAGFIGTGLSLLALDYTMEGNE